ncbi:MAG: pentapeptide repeat-containing protein [Betaproteobacteria bacterium]
MTRNDTIASLAVNAWINRGRVVWPWADLRGCDLSGADLSGADLSGCDLSGCDLFECDLSGADLSGAYLHGAKIDFGGRTFTLKEADQ